MKIIPIIHGTFKVDGGAMFGPVPKAIWQKKYPADENNLCTLTLRSLLIEDESRLFLIDTGIGTKHSEKFLSFIYPQLNDIHEILKKHGYSTKDITDVIVTHLHYDHAGGCTYKNEDGQVIPTFSNATYWISKQQIDLLQNPNPREKAALFPEDIVPVLKAGQLKILEKDVSLSKNITLFFSFGHTEGMLVPIIKNGSQIIIFAADTIPTLHNIHIPWISAYDNHPLTLMNEKKSFLTMAAENNYIFIFEHDYYNESATVQYNKEKDRFFPKEIKQLNELS